VETAVGRPREEKADFWTAVGGQYKASIDYIVRITMESGAAFVRGPEVRVQTMRTRMVDAPAGTMIELSRFGGSVRDGDGEPVADAWVVLPDTGQWTATDGEGHFTFQRVSPGPLRILARTAAGDEVGARPSGKRRPKE
jgi:hypothetical protein